MLRKVHYAAACLTLLLPLTAVSLPCLAETVPIADESRFTKCFGLGQKAAGVNDLASARRYFLEALSIAESTSSLEKQLAAFIWLYNCSRTQEDYKKWSSKWLQLADKHLKELSLDNQVIRLRFLADEAAGKADAVEAQRLNLEALTLLRNQKKVNRTLLSALTVRLVEDCRQLKQYKKMQELADYALTLFNPSEKSDVANSSYQELLEAKADSLIVSDKLDEAESILKGCLDYQRKQNATRQILTVLEKLADIQVRRRRFVEAAEYHQQIQEIQIAFNFGANAIRANQRQLAWVYLQGNRLIEAEKLFQELLSTCGEGEWRLKTSTLEDLGEIYANRKDFPKALEYYLQCEAEYKKVKAPPDLIAKFSDRMASFYLESSDFSNAEKYAREAIRLTENDDKRLARRLIRLGNSFYRRANYVESLKYFEQAFEQIKKVADADDFEKNNVERWVASAQLRLGNYKEAERIFEHAKSTMQPLSATEYRSVMSDVAWCKRELKKFDECEQTLKELYKKQVSSGATDESQAATLSDFGYLYMAMGQNKQAENDFRKALDISQRNYDAEDGRLVWRLADLAWSLREQHRFSEALELLQRALKLAQSKRGSPLDGPSIMNMMALTYKADKKFDEALAMYKQSLSAKQQVLGPCHEDVAQLFANIADAYWDYGKYQEAHENYKNALAIYRKLFSPSHPTVIFQQCNAAGCLRELKKTMEAKDEYLQCLAILEKQFGPDSRELVQPLDGLSACYKMLKDYPNQQATLERAIKIADAKPFERDQFKVNMLRFLAESLESQNKERRGAWERCVSENIKLHGEKSPQAALARWSLANYLYAQKHYRESLPYYAAAIEVCQTSSKKSDLLVLYNDAALAHYFGNDNPTAEKYERKTLALDAEIGERKNLAFHLRNLGWILDDEQKLDEAEETYKQALRAIEPGSDDLLSAKILTWLSDVQRRQQKISDALSNLDKAEKLFATLSDAARKPEDLEKVKNIRKLCSASPNSTETKPQQSVALLEKNQDNERVIECRNLAMSKHTAGERQDAKRLFEKLCEMQDVAKRASEFENVSDIYFRAGEYLEAIPFVERALLLHEQAGEKVEAALCYFMIGNCAMEAKDKGRAEQNFQKAFERGRQHLSSSRVRDYWRKALLNYYEDRPVDKLKLLRELATWLEQYPESTEMAQCLLDQSDALQYQMRTVRGIDIVEQKRKEAISTLQRAATILRSNQNDENKPLLAQCLTALASLQEESSNNSLSAELFDEIEKNKIAQSANGSASAITSLPKAEFLRRTGEFFQALSLYKRIIQEEAETKKTERLLPARIGIIKCLWSTGQIDAAKIAIKDFEQTYPVETKERAFCELVSAFINIEAGAYDEAERLINRAVQRKNEEVDNDQVSITRGDIALARKQLDEAERLYRVDGERGNEFFLEGIVRLAQCYRNDSTKGPGLLDIARKSLLEEMRESGLQAGLITSLMRVAKDYDGISEFETAERVADECVALSSKSPNAFLHRLARGVRGQVLLHSGKISQAFVELKPIVEELPPDERQSGIWTPIIRDYAIACIEFGETDSTEALLKNALENDGRSYGINSARCIDDLIALAMFYLSQGRLEQAQDHCTTVLKNLNATRYAQARVHAIAGEINLAKGSNKDALSHLKTALDLLQSETFVRKHESATIERLTAWAEFLNGDIVNAKQRLTKARDMHAAALGANDFSVSTDSYLLAKVCASKSQTEESKQTIRTLLDTDWNFPLPNEVEKIFFAENYQSAPYISTVNPSPRQTLRLVFAADAINKTNMLPALKSVVRYLQEKYGQDYPLIATFLDREVRQVTNLGQPDLVKTLDDRSNALWLQFVERACAPDRKVDRSIENQIASLAGPNAASKRAARELLENAETLMGTGNGMEATRNAEAAFQCCIHMHGVILDLKQIQLALDIVQFVVADCDFGKARGMLDELKSALPADASVECQAECDNMQAQISAAEGDFTKAKSVLTLRLQNIALKNKSVLARLYDTLSDVFAGLNDNDASIKYANAALNDSDPEANPLEYSRRALDLTTLYAMNDKFAEAATALKKVNSEDLECRIRSLICKSFLQRESNETDGAVQSLNSALKLCADVKGKSRLSYELKIYNALAVIALKKGDYNGASSQLQYAANRADKYINNIYPQLSFAEQCAFSQNTITTQLNLMLTALSYQNDPVAAQKAYDYILSWKGLLIHGLHRRSQLMQSVIDEKDWNGRATNSDTKKLVDEFQSTCAQLEKIAVQKGKLDSEEWHQQYIQLTDKKETLERRISHSLRNVGVYDPASKAVTKGISELLESDEAIADLYEFKNTVSGKKSLMAFVLTRSSPLATVAFTDTDKIDSALEAWLGSLSGRQIKRSSTSKKSRSVVNIRPSALAQTEASARKQLDTLLWTPISERLQPTINRVIVCADGTTNQIPWSLFSTSNSSILVSNIDSPRQFVEMRNRALFESTRSKDWNSILVVGDIDFGSSSVPSLPGTRVEVDNLTQLAAKCGLKNSILRNALPDKKTVSEALPTFNIAHFATHGYFVEADENSPKESQPTQISFISRSRASADLNSIIDTRNVLLGSGLYLSPIHTKTKGSREVPELLTAEDVLHLRLDDCRLITLSACETGLGGHYQGQGMLGLRASLMAAGANCVVMSLWKVPDEATQKLMSAFYSALLEDHQSPAQALKTAQQKLRSVPKFAAPTNWAAWVVVGNAW